MKISIVTISFNQVDFLKYCIESIVNQPDYIELIVVDPGSTDGSRELIDSYGDRIIKVYEKDEGPADGLNKGFKKATGEILGFINSDDALIENASTSIINIFKKSKTDVLTGVGYFIDENNKRLAKVASSKFTPWLYALGAVTIFQQSTFFSKNSFENVGGFNIENRSCWDSELFFDMAKSGSKFKVCNIEIGLFRVHSSSISGSGNFVNLHNKDTKRISKDYFTGFVGVINKNLSKFNFLIKILFDPAYLFRKGSLKKLSVKRFVNQN